MNVIKSLIRPCRFTSSSFFRRPTIKQMRFFTALPENSTNFHIPLLNTTYSPSGIINYKSCLFYTTEAIDLLENVDATEEQPFEIFRAKALRNGIVLERDFERLLDTLDTKDGKQQLVFLLNCCAESLPNLIGEKKIAFASKIWQMFAANSYKFNPNEVLAFLRVHSAGGVEVNLNAWWITPEVEKLIEDRKCLLLLLQCASECGNLKASAEVLSKMKEQGFPIGEEELAYCILGEGRAKNFKGVSTHLESMRTAQMKPGQLTYYAMLQAEISNDQPISETLKKMQSELIKLTEEQIVKIIHSLAIANNAKPLSSILRLFPINGLGHEVQNLIIQLIHEGKHFFACNIYPSLLKDLKPEELGNNLSFFPAELVKSDKGVEDILEICLSLQTNFPNHNSFLLSAVERSLRDKSKGPLSMELLSHISPLRTHYFWPLFIRSTCIEDVVDVLKKMHTLNVKPDHDTLAYYVFPNLLPYDTPMNILRHLQTTCQLTITKQLGPMLNALLNAKQINEALDLCKMIKSRTLDARKLIKPLANALLETGLIHSSAYLLALIVDSKKYQDIDVVGLFLASYCYKCNTTDLKELFGQLAKFQLRISLAGYDIISTKATVRQIGLQHLDMLTSSAYGGVSTFSSLPRQNEMNVEELEAHLIELKSKEMNTRGVLRKLLQAHCRFNNVDRALQIKKELDTERCEYSPGILSSLLSLYIKVQDVRSATDTYHQLEEYPRFILDEHKIIDFCKLKVKTGSTLDDITSTLNSYISHLRRNRRTPRLSALRNCQELVEEIKTHFGDESAQEISTKLSEYEFM